MGGGSSSCTCNVRICNYHKKGGYGFNTEKEKINTKTQVEDLKNTLEDFMDPEDSPSSYLRTGVRAPWSSDESASQSALNKLRNTIASVTPIEGLTMDAFCVNVTDSYKKTTPKPITQTPTPSTSEPFALEGYTMIKPKPTCSAIICIITAIIVFTFIGYLVYRYINCPCRKRREKELREAEKSLKYTT